MRKLITIICIFLIAIFALEGCKRYKDKDLYGTWYASIDSTDACGYNKVIIEFDKNDIAYLNYSGPNGNKWNPSYQCKWWMEKKKNPKRWLLYVLRFDTLGSPCIPCANCIGSFYHDVLLPDTTLYEIEYIKDNSIKLYLNGGGYGNRDLLFSDEWIIYIVYQTLYKEN